MLLEMTRAAQAGLRKERQYELVSNHLANANTTGYKKEILSFDRLMKANLSTDFSQGTLVETGNSLDLALGDHGFFKLETPSGVRYTRNGNFVLSTDNRIVDQSGNYLLAVNGPIIVDGDQVTIDKSGNVFVDGEPLTTLDIVDFRDRETLYKESSSLFVHRGDPLDETPAETVSVKQGALEESNLNVVTEMTKMIETHRLYDTMQRMMKSLDETDSKANTMGAPGR